jgi:hypothetical protein
VFVTLAAVGSALVGALTVGVGLLELHPMMAAARPMPTSSTTLFSIQFIFLFSS